MKKLFVAALTGSMMFLNMNNINAQERLCGNELIEQEIKNDPYKKAFFEEYYKQYAEENKTIAQDAERAESKTTAADVLIPVVFHIVLNAAQIQQMGGQAGIIDRINTQLEVINEDFNAKNADLSGVPEGFKSLIGDARIGFALAKRDANGKAKLGIEWVTKDASFTGYSTTDHSVKRKVMGGSNPWDYTKYLNVWITLIQAPSQGGQVLGYAYNSVYASNTSGDPALAGVVLHYLTLGRRTGIGQVFYSSSTDKGRTMTHELGHFFNIWHIWGRTTAAGDTSCTEDDGIADTPEQKAANFTCPIGIKPNCPNAPHPAGEMYMNYMDYSSDVCAKMFSKGQVLRMKTELGNGGQVHSLSLNPQLAFWPADVSAVEHNNKVDIAPNPASGNFNILLLDKYNELKTINVTNTVGQTVKQIQVTDQQATSYNVDASALPRGVYIVQLNFDEGVISRKVVIE